MNRTELQQLAEDRAQDAEVLLKEQRWSGAYYLAGYAVECGLKACVLVHIEKTGIIFQDKKFVANCWTHDIGELAKLADLERERGLDTSANLVRGKHWLTVEAWNVEARYLQWTEVQARKICEAVTDTRSGILPWIKTRW